MLLFIPELVSLVQGLKINAEHFFLHLYLSLKNINARNIFTIKATWKAVIYLGKLWIWTEYVCQYSV